MFTPDAWSDYQFWLQTDKMMLGRVNALIENVRRTPFLGIGKPEPLRGEFSGIWSRRIDREHRLLYGIEGTGAGQTIVIVACRFHYQR